MKKLFLSLSIIIAAASLVACSKDKGSGQPANGYNGQYGQYGSTPNEQCVGGGYQGMPYQGYQQGGYYGQQYGQQYGQYGQQYGQPQYGQQYGQGYRPNCIPPGAIQGGNPYYMQVNYQMYLGTCDMRYAGRIQICPPSYTCQPAYGSMGVCMRM